MTDTQHQQHTPPGGWPWSKGKDASLSEHPKKDDPPEYFDDKKNGAKDTKDAKDAKDSSQKPVKDTKAKDSVKDTTKKAKDSAPEADGETAESKEVKEAAKDGVDVTQEPEQMSKDDDGDGGGETQFDELKAGLRMPQSKNGPADKDRLTEVDPNALTEEEKEKLTPGKDSDATRVGKEAEEAGDKSKAAKKGVDDDAPKKGEKAAKDADIPKEGEDAVKEGEKATEGEAPKEGEEALKDGKDAAEGEPPKDGDEPLKEGEDALKEGEKSTEEAPKEGEEALKDGTDAVEGETPKEGDEPLKEGEDSLKEGEKAAEDEAPKEGEEAVKEGEEAKEGTDAAEESAPDDLSVLKGGKVNKGGNVVDDEGKVVGRIKEGVLANLVGKRVDESGIIWNDSGKQIGVAELIPEDEREAMLKEPAPFESFPDAVVDSEGYVVFNDERVGKVVDGDIKRLRGMKVDPDGDILDRGGNVVGKAERWEAEKEAEPEPEPEVDQSLLAGKRVNKAGNVVDSNGNIFGRVVEGDAKRMVGRMCDKKGNILSESGDVLGRAELIPEGEREGLKEGPFAELSGCTVTKDGKVVTPGGDVVGRLTSGDAKTLFGRLVDEDGDVCDKNGNVLGKAERWSEPEVEKKKGPMAGRRVNKEGNVVDEDGNVIGKLTSGELSICGGKEVDDDGDVVDGKGTTVGHVSLLGDIPEPTESDDDKTKREQAASDKKLAQQMAYCLTQCLDKVKPICSMISSKIEKAERTPKEELDEEELVKEVRPLIEEGGKILQEANGIIRGLDPDGRIQANAKHNTAKREATPEEYHLADILKELTGTVTTTIDNAKKKIEGMPHAKKELNPLWGLLSEPLFQILAAVGMLLSGVLGLVGQLLSGLGLGGLVDGLLGGLGVKNILAALGVGGLTDSLTGKNKGGKKKGGLLGLGG